MFYQKILHATQMLIPTPPPTDTHRQTCKLSHMCINQSCHHLLKRERWGRTLLGAFSQRVRLEYHNAELLIQQTLRSPHNPTPLIFDDAVWRCDQNRLYPVCIVKSKTEQPHRDGEMCVCVCVLALPLQCI